MKDIVISHEVWANNTYCPVHDVGKVKVTIADNGDGNGDENGDGNGNGDGNATMEMEMATAMEMEMATAMEMEMATGMETVTWMEMTTGTGWGTAMTVCRPFASMMWQCPRSTSTQCSR